MNGTTKFIEKYQTGLRKEDMYKVIKDSRTGYYREDKLFYSSLEEVREYKNYQDYQDNNDTYDPGPKLKLPKTEIELLQGTVATLSRDLLSANHIIIKFREEREQDQEREVKLTRQ